MKLKTQGVTLIELMIAVAISLILLLGVGSVYYNSKKTYLVQEEFARLQENARFGMKFLVEDIRMAGYVGCAWNDNLNFENFLNPTGNAQDDDPFNRFNVGLEGREADNTGANDLVNLATYAGAWNTPLSTYLSNAPTPGSDILIVRYADGNGVRLSRNNNSATIWFEDLGDTNTPNVGGTTCHLPSGICEGDILLVTDCEKSRLFQVTAGMANNPGSGIGLAHAAAGTPGNDPATVSWQNSDFFNADDSHLFRAAAYAYYIAPGTGANGEPALYREELRPNSQPEELVEGVENMQILYGIDLDKTAGNPGDGVANRYVTADQVDPNIDNIVSARISLLLRTANNVNTKTAAVPVAKDYLLSGMTNASGTTIRTVPDRRLRKVFTTTIKVRNKGL